MSPNCRAVALKALIEAGAVAVDGRTIRDPSHRVNAGAAIAVDVPPPEPAKPAPEPIPLAVVYEDDDIIVIDKPRGLVVHPAAGNWTGTLVNALIAHCGDSLSGIGGERRPGIVHRLDKDTTGLMVVAKNDRAHRSLAAQFADHGRDGSRSSAAISPSSGARRTGPHGTIDKPIDRHPQARDRMAVRAGGREAVTHWQVLERYAGEPARPSGKAERRRRPSRWRASSPAGWKPAAPTRSGSIWPRSAIRCWATTSMGPDSGPKPPFAASGRRTPWRPLADRPCMPIYCGRAPVSGEYPDVPVGTAARSRPFTSCIGPQSGRTPAEMSSGR